MLTARQLAAERRLIEVSKKQASNFGRLYERYFDRVYAFAITRTGDRTAAEDVMAETFRIALQNISRFEWRGMPFSAWLFRIAANAAADLHRRAARESALGERTDEATEPYDLRFIEAEERARLFELVQRLPKAQRDVILRWSAHSGPTSPPAVQPPVESLLSTAPSTSSGAYPKCNRPMCDSGHRQRQVVAQNMRCATQVTVGGRCG